MGEIITFLTLGGLSGPRCWLGLVVWCFVLSAWAGLTFLVVVCRVWCLALWSQLAWLSSYGLT